MTETDKERGAELQDLVATLRESERKLRAVINQTFQFIGLMRTDGILFDVNDTALAFSGVKREDVVDRPFWEGPWWAHSPELQARLRDAIEEAAAGGFVRFEATHPAKDGRLHYIDFSLKPVVDDAGAVILLVPEGRDITERKEAEEALLASERRYRALHENLRDGLAVVDMAGTIIEHNPAFREILGYSDEEIRGLTYEQITPARWHAREAGVLAEQVMKRGYSDIYEKEYIRKDGTVFPVEVRTYLERNSDGSPRGMWAFVRDITERKESERRMTHIFNFLPDATVVINDEGKVIAWNRAMEELTGVKAADMLGKGDHEYAIPFYGERRPMLVDLALLPREEMASKYSQFLRAGDVLTAEVDVPRLRGRGACLIGRASALRDSRSRVVGAIEIVRDVTEQRDAERRWGDIFNLLPDAAVVINTEHKVIAWNRAMEELTGVKAADMLGKGDYEYAIPFYGERRPILVDLALLPREEMVAKYSQFMQAGDVLIAEVYVSHRGVHLNGRASVLRDWRDRVVGAIEIVRDITERKQAEEALRASEEQFRALFDKSNDAIYIHDLEARILDANQAACSLLGYSVDELRGLRATDVDTPEQAGHVPERVAALQRHGRAVFESVHRRKDGTTFPVEVSSSFMDYRGTTAIISICRDITERKRAEGELLRAKEAADAASEAKSAFLANMSHEIRTPINGMLGMIGLALDTDLSAEQRGYLELAKASADALLTIINDILDFSKIEAQKLEIEHVDFDLVGVLEKSLLVLGGEAQEKGLELVYDLRPPMRRRYRGDPTRLGQVVANLVKNAIKFTGKGHVLLTGEEVGGGALGATKLHFSVEDTGIGIPSDKLSTIFETFTQADSSTTRRFGGTGLGLAICKRLVQMMGGEIWVESELGEGARFHFTVVVGAPDVEVEALEEPAEVRLEGLRALVVDDNELNRQILRERLLSWGVVVDEARDGAQCLAEIEASRDAGRPHDLLLLDQVMPGMSGLEVVERLQGSGLESVTIVMLTSLDQKGHRERCRELGVGEYLVKPVSPSTLLEAIIGVVAKTPGRSRAPRTTREVFPPRPDVPDDLAVLLAEDHMVNRKLALALLSKIGLRPDTAENGVEVLQRLESRTYDLVFMDIQMPLMDGVEATRRIRQRERERGGHVPIVALTAHAMKGDMERFLEAGMDDYLTKPLSPVQLYQVVEKFALQRGASAGREQGEVAAQRAAGRAEAAAPRRDVQPPPVLLDVAALKGRAADDEELAADLLAIYRDEAPRALQKLERAAAEGTAEELRAAAHALKGISASASAVGVQELARAVEQASRAGETRQAAELVSRLAQTLAVTIEEIDRAVRDMRGREGGDSE